MCFSARASFAAAALLVPLGSLALRHVWREGADDRLPLALTPLLFALQQVCEGLVWLRLGPVPGALVPPEAATASLAYLFFAYGLWPGWIPFAALRWGGASLSAQERRWIKAAVVVGFLFGLLLWLPLLRDPASALPSLVHGSLRYPVTPVVPGVAGQLLGQALYVVLIVGPLLLPPGELRIFGIAVLVAFASTQLAFTFALTSVWCYFSALLSLLILWIVVRDRPALEVPLVPGPAALPLP